MKIHIEIVEPRNQYDTFGKPIKGPIKSLGPFESYKSAIDWLKMLEQREQIPEIKRK